MEYEEKRQLYLVTAWKRGFLSYKLKPEQKKIYAAMQDSKERTGQAKFVINCSRRLGKSYMLTLLALEKCIRYPGIQVTFVAPTLKQIKDIVKPIFHKIIEDCPKPLRPKLALIDSEIRFKNGSVIKLGAGEKHTAERLRGLNSDLIIFDEPRNVDTEQLKIVVNDILQPQLLTARKDDPMFGMMIFGSTPPDSPAHYFTSNLLANAEAHGSCIQMKIYENTMITQKDIIDCANESGCKVENGIITQKSTTFLREYEADATVTEESMKIIPEYTQEMDEKCIFKDEIVPPDYFDCYISLDIGMIDLSACLFGYWDFKTATLVIQREFTMNYKDKMTTLKLANKIKEIEEELWNHQVFNTFKRTTNNGKVYRIMDNDLIMTSDFFDAHALLFHVTEKDNKEAAVNAVRLAIQSGKIRIHESCKELRAHLKYGIWNKTRKSYERSGDWGHFDTIDALVYLWRNLRLSDNPYPVLPHGVTRTTHFIPEELEKKQHHDLSKMFNK